MAACRMALADLSAGSGKEEADSFSLLIQPHPLFQHPIPARSYMAALQCNAAGAHIVASSPASSIAASSQPSAPERLGSPKPSFNSFSGLQLVSQIDGCAVHPCAFLLDKEMSASKVADSFINLKAQLPTIPEACERQKQGKKEKKRNKRLSISDNISLCLDEEDAFAKFYSRKGCRPLGLISNILSCLHNQKGNCAPNFFVQTIKVEALVELNKRQQVALVDKHDTIDMLEWQIEQMQQMSVKEREHQQTSLQIDAEQEGPKIGSGTAYF